MEPWCRAYARPKRAKTRHIATPAIEAPLALWGSLSGPGLLFGPPPPIPTKTAMEHNLQHTHTHMICCSVTQIRRCAFSPPAPRTACKCRGRASSRGGGGKGGATPRNRRHSAATLAPNLGSAGLRRLIPCCAAAAGEKGHSSRRASPAREAHISARRRVQAADLGGHRAEVRGQGVGGRAGACGGAQRSSGSDWLRETLRCYADRGGDRSVSVRLLEAGRCVVCLTWQPRLQRLPARVLVANLTRTSFAAVAHYRRSRVVCWVVRWFGTAFGRSCGSRCSPALHRGAQPQDLIGRFRMTPLFEPCVRHCHGNRAVSASFPTAYSP